MAHPARGLLDERAGLNVDVQLHAREPRAQLVERDHASVRDALADLPLDPLVRALLDDLGRELLRDTPDLGLERDVGLVLLGHLLEAVHELRPLLELRPLVVGGLQRNADVDVLLDRHAPALAHSRDALRLAALAALAAERVLHASAKLLPRLLQWGGAIAAQPLDELAGALRGHWNECGCTNSCSDPLHAGERAVPPARTR